MRIARQGYRFIVGSFVVAAIGIAIGPVGWAPAFAALVFGLFCLYFFRDPERTAPTDDRLYSPGDGRVLSIAREGPGTITTVRIFLSIFNVHVQRNACSGTVEKVVYQKGGFLMAMKPGAAQNERSIVTVRPAGGREPVIVEQIAGAIARRIETWIKPGQSIRAGERYGIIYFGSQVAVHLPAGTRVLVEPGAKVVGGVTPIAEWTA